jgi:hypothetical protein
MMRASRETGAVWPGAGLFAGMLGFLALLSTLWLIAWLDGSGACALEKVTRTEFLESRDGGELLHTIEQRECQRWKGDE